MSNLHEIEQIVLLHRISNHRISIGNGRLPGHTGMVLVFPYAGFQSEKGFQSDVEKLTSDSACATNRQGS